MLDRTLLGPASFSEGETLLVYGPKARIFIAKLQALFDERTDVIQFNSKTPMDAEIDAGFAAYRGRFLIYQAETAHPEVPWIAEVYAGRDDVADVIRWTRKGDKFGLQLRLTEDGRAVVEASE